MKKVLLAPSSFGEVDDEPVRLLRASGFDPVPNPFKRRLTQAEVTSLLGTDVIGLIAGLEPLTREVLSASSVRVISRVGSGMSNVDLEAADDLGISVFSTPAGPARAVAELTVGCLLSLLRSVPFMDRRLRGGAWEKVVGVQLLGKVVAIIGVGNIGRSVADLLSCLGAEILAVDPFVDADSSPFPLVSLEQALEAADIVSLHVSGEHCLLDRDAFGLMSDGVWVLNASRGSVVDEDALIGALRSGQVKGAWIDTFKLEPYQGALTEFDQVILTPHVGSYTVECRRSMELEAVQNLIHGLSQSS